MPIDKDPVDMADEAEDEHVVEQEKTCNDSVSKDDYSSRLAVEADGHKIEYALLSHIGPIIPD